MYINIHSHHADSNNWVLQNVYPNIVENPLPARFSAGLHPWHLTSNWQTEIVALQNLTANSQLLAIGECGLDKVCTTNWDLQMQAFVAQVQLANQIQKPLIVHCVRAYAEVVQTLLKNNNQVPVIFHGFNKQLPLAESLVEKGFYLSFGKAILHETVATYLQQLPLSNIFLETDDANVTIQEIYTAFAKAYAIGEEQLSLQLQKNVETVFNTTI